MATLSLFACSPLDRILSAFAARDHVYAEQHSRRARDCRHVQRQRSHRIERTCAQREADAAELRDLKLDPREEG